MFTLKIAVPWPPKNKNQIRIKESLKLWKNKNQIFLCMVEKDNDVFLESFDKILLKKNSLSMQTKYAKCFIHDMLEQVVANNPETDWYGFGNSDIVPVDDFSQNCLEDEEVLIFHRTDISSWDDINFYFNNLNNLNVDLEILKKIYFARSSGVSDKYIAKKLNINAVPCPNREEWNYESIRDIFKFQGKIFLWGQDLFLFNKKIVHKVLKYLKEYNPIFSVGGFDPRITKWLINNFKTKRILNKIYHKIHLQEWSRYEREYSHNGGDLPINSTNDYYLSEYCFFQKNELDRPIFTKPLIQILKKKNKKNYLDILNYAKLDFNKNNDIINF
jgi:hypothetical protein